MSLHVYFLKIEEISIKLHKEPSYFMEVNNGKPLRRIMGITQEATKTVTMSQASGESKSEKQIKSFLFCIVLSYSYL